MSSQVEQFVIHVRDYYKRNKRILAWRENRSTYGILISEIMLQQTQVQRVVSKYEEFLASFKTIQALSKATLEEVLLVWQGMGYNRRAKYLHDASKIIVEKYGGNLPESIEDLDGLPGIGVATASSLYVFNTGLRADFIETNIRRVFIHHFFHDADKVSDTNIYPVLSKVLDYVEEKRFSLRDFYYALMDYGSYLVKHTTNPNRKSLHYKKQAPFVGSFRQVRARVLKQQLAGKVNRSSLTEIEKQALASLIKDGLIEGGV